MSRLKTEVHVAVELSTLLRLNEHPGYLEGHGPIDAEYARALALGPDSTWRRLITDPITGQLLDVGRTRYRAPEALDEHVRVRDSTCRTPGCSRPARDCDVDHVVPYPAGTTSNDNLNAKCRRDHRLKHEGRWRHEVSTDPDQPPHTIVLTSPMGVQHVTHATIYTHPQGPPAPDPDSPWIVHDPETDNTCADTSTGTGTGAATTDETASGPPERDPWAGPADGEVWPDDGTVPF